MDMSLKVLQVYALFTSREITNILIPPKVPRNGSGERFSCSTNFTYTMRMDALLVPRSRVDGNPVMRLVINSGLKASGVVSGHR